MARLYFLPIVVVIKGLVLCLFIDNGEAQTFREFRKTYLGANSFEELRIRSDQSSVNKFFYQLLKDVVHDEPEIAADLVIQTHRLVRQNIEARGPMKQIKSGGNYITGFLSYYEDVIETLDCIGVRVRTYRQDQEGLIPYTGKGNNAQKFLLFSHFLSLGGNYNTTRALDLLLKDLRVVCGEGQSIFLAPYFFDFAYNLRPTQRDLLAKFAIEKSRETDLTVSGFAEAIHLGLAIFERTESTPISSPNLWRGNELDTKLMEILQNETLSPAWRAGLTSLIGRNFRDEIPSSLRSEIGRVLSRVLNENMSFPGSSFKYSIAAFLRGSNDDPSWQSQGRELIAAWEKRSSRSLTPPTSRLEPDRSWSVPMTELICRVGSESQINAHFKRFCLDDIAYPGIWINLVKAGKHNLANQAWLKQGLVNEFSKDHFQVDTGFDTELAEAIPPYLDSINDLKMQSLAELQLAATPNLFVKKPEAPDSAVQSRFDAFAAKYESLPQWSDQQMVRGLEILSLSQRNPKIKNWIEERQIGLEKRIEQEKSRSRPFWAGRIEMHAAAEELERGLSFPIELWWGRAVEDENQTIARRSGDLCRAVLTMMDERIIAGCEQKDLKRLSYFLPVSRSILEFVPDYIYPSYIRQFAVRVLTAHSLCGEIEQWSKWWKTIDPVRRRHLISVLPHSSELIPALDSLFNPNNLAPDKVFDSPEERRRVMTEILSAEWVDEGYSGYSNLANATAVRLLTKPDIYDMAEAISRRAPRDGSSWREYLGILSDQGQLDEALRIVEEEIAVTDPTLPLISALKVEKLYILKALGRESDAATFLSEFVTSDFDLPREYQAVARNLSKR